jgi:hypothetical protein
LSGFSKNSKKKNLRDAFRGYRLEYDNSWTPLNEINRVDDRKALIEKVMNQKLSLKDAI